MADRFEQLNAIVKERYETGAYGNARFEMNADVLAAMRESAPPPPARLPFMPNSLGELLAIPIVLADLPAGTWRLVENGTDEVLQEGSIDG